jgi:N-acetylglutamate synthase-like GNAT family acetyltransferase
MSNIHIRTKTEADQTWCADLLTTHWGSTQVVSRGRLHDANTLPGFIAESQGKPIGLLTYRIEDTQCEIVSLNSLLEKRGIASTLLDAVEKEATHHGCRRLWLITTNDNIPAIHFYQKRGFTLAALHADAVRAARERKPEIPERGWDEIPIRDEIEFEKILQPSS